MRIPPGRPLRLKRTTYVAPVLPMQRALAITGITFATYLPLPPSIPPLVHWPWGPLRDSTHHASRHKVESVSFLAASTQALTTFSPGIHTRVTMTLSGLTGLTQLNLAWASSECSSTNTPTRRPADDLSSSITFAFWRGSPATLRPNFQS